MGFLAPYMLFGALAASIPIALHFFFRSRYRTVPWAAMKFLLTSIEQTSRRLKFQELLLLAARVALLVLLALALARPLTSSAVGSGRGPVDAVFILDTSFSMGARQGTQDRLDVAKEAALRVLDQLPPYSTAQVVTCADRAVLLGPRASANLDQVRDVIQKVELTHLATDFAPGAVEASAALKRGNAANKELYLFSDMQKLGWEAQAGALKKSLEELQQDSAIYLVRVGSQTPRNVAVVGIAPQSGIPRPGERVGFAVLVRNTGAVAVDNLTVSLKVGNAAEEDSQPIARLEPKETRAVPLTGKLLRAGHVILAATVKHDDLPGDDQFHQVLNLRDQVRVLVVDGAPNTREPEKAASYYLMHALTPVRDAERPKYHVRPLLVSARQAAPGQLASVDLCVLVNCALERDSKRAVDPLQGDFVEELGKFVRQGKGLIIFAGDNVSADSYNRVLGKNHGLLPMPLAGVASHAKEQPLHFQRKSAAASALVPFREDAAYKFFDFIPIWRTLVLTEPAKDAKATQKPEAGDAARVLLRYNSGAPALVSRQVEAGEVLLVATSADPGRQPKSDEPTWNYLFGFPDYVPFVQALLAHLLERQTQIHNYTAGAAFLWHSDEKDASQSFALLGPRGERLPLGRPQRLEGRPIVEVPATLRAGVYYLAQSATPKSDEEPRDETDPAPRPDGSLPGAPFALLADLRESDNLESLSNEEIDRLLGFRPFHVTIGNEDNAFAGTQRTNQEWTIWLLAAVLLVGVGEAILAWLCGRAW
jgi:hypothetical protein